MFCCNHTCYCVGMVSVTLALHNVASASGDQSRSSMYIRGLVPQNFMELANAVPIDCLLSLPFYVGFCVVSLFYGVVLGVLSSLEIILLRKRVFAAYGHLISVSLPHCALGWSGVSDCGISWSFSLFLSFIVGYTFRKQVLRLPSRVTVKLYLMIYLPK